MIDEDLALLPELLLDLLLAGAREVRRALADPAQSQGVTLGRDLDNLNIFGKFWSNLKFESQPTMPVQADTTSCIF